MKNPNLILLPGLSQQLSFLFSKIEIENLVTLIVGANSEQIAQKFLEKNIPKVEIIVEEYDSLINSQLILNKNENIRTRIMDFENTDFSDSQFDLIYAQGSISNLRRKKIVKEIKKILKPEGYFCVGELIKLTEDVPTFVQNIFDASELEPLFINDIDKYYTERKFEVIDTIDLSRTLKQFYIESAEILRENIGDLSENEKSYNKKLLNKISHESNAFLKQGASKFIGFKALLLKKK